MLNLLESQVVLRTVRSHHQLQRPCLQGERIQHSARVRSFGFDALGMGNRDGRGDRALKTVFSEKVLTCQGFL